MVPSSSEKNFAIDLFFPYFHAAVLAKQNKKIPHNKDSTSLGQIFFYFKFSTSFSLTTIVMAIHIYNQKKWQNRFKDLSDKVFSIPWEPRKVCGSFIANYRSKPKIKVH